MNSPKDKIDERERESLLTTLFVLHRFNPPLDF